MAYGKATGKEIILLVISVLLLTSCTVTIAPIKDKPAFKPPVHHRQHRSSRIPPHVEKPPAPNPSVSPLPPDDRIIDIIKQIDKDKQR